MSWNPDDRHVSERLGRFYSLTDLIKSAYDANDLPAAATLADEYLQLASVYRCNWNYGNAIHDAHKYLGLIRLKDNDPAGAAAYLLKSVKSSGSPQLNSFGPELDLANSLLQAGHVEPVKLYLRDIKSFWEMDNGRVDEWLASIDNGEKPILNRFPPKRFQLDYNVILATDSIASYDDEYHRESIRYLAQSIGRPMTNGEIRESLRATATQGYSKEQ